MDGYSLLENWNYWNHLRNSERNIALAIDHAAGYTWKHYRRTIFLDTDDHYSASSMVMPDFTCDNKTEESKILTEQEGPPYGSPAAGSPSGDP